MGAYVLDTTVVVKGLVEPRREKKDSLHQNAAKLHKEALRFLKECETGNISVFVPSVALVETAAVISRLTNDRSSSEDAVDFMMQNMRVLFDYEVLDKAVDLGIKTKASGFDSVFLAAASVSGGTLVTDDAGMHKAALSL